MCVAMSMWLASGIIRLVTVLVGLVVNVSVWMLLRLMRMHMFVPFRHVEPHAYDHESTSCSQLVGDTLMQHNDGNHSPKEGRGGKIRGCTCAA